MIRGREEQCKIGDYGIIGDSRAAALVSRDGSIDWLCWPRFDSASIFAAILDRDRGGYWSIRPAGSFRSQRAYVRDTNVLETQYIVPSGRATLTDFMPVASEAFKHRNLVPDHEMVRQIECTEGEIGIEVDFYPRPDYGLKSAQIREIRGLGLRMDVGRGAYWLRSTFPMQAESDRAKAILSLKRGETVQFSLTYSEESPTVLVALGRGVRENLDRTILWWQRWAGISSYDGPYEESVTRSALALKLLTYAPSGAIAAAATTSLPERIGAGLNWDYRFCWLRDASLTTRAMLGLGYLEEAESFLTWLLHATQLTQPQLRVLYTVFGQIAPQERQIKELTGYYNSAPVRVGNGARGQLQLDIYGEVIDATAQFALHKMGFDRTTQKVLVGFGKYVAEHWDNADSGIWEPREGPRNHTHSRLMCWAALDRLLALSEKGIVHGVPRDLFTRERDKIRAQIETRAWNGECSSYVSVLDGNGDDMDATLLRLAWYGFEQADSERMKNTYERVRQQLCPGNNLLYRYPRNPPEGAFGVCGFWGVEHLALSGTNLDEAHRAFQQLLQYQNDLGLFAEEIDPETGEALGNFPQGFTHIGLISAALTLAEQERGKAHPAIQVGSDVKPSAAESKL